MFWLGLIIGIFVAFGIFIIIPVKDPNKSAFCDHDTDSRYGKTKCDFCGEEN